MGRYDQGFIDGLLSLAQRRTLTAREQGALNKAIRAANERSEKQRKHDRKVERRQIRKQNGR